ncbi:MAG: hypothetical protein II916_04310 [Oscillospiraceae bacterium]|nr:hypothetical protein [Oscillospiraceae bacterium]
MKGFLRTITAVASAVTMLASCTGMTAFAVSDTLTDYREIIVSQVNDLRAEAGLRPVALTPQLSGYAQTRAEELTSIFSHTRPNGEVCFTVMKNDGFFYNYAAENIAAGGDTPVMTFLQFANSPNHLKNMMNPDMTHIGIGYVKDLDAMPEPDGKQYGFYWAMLLTGVYDANSQPQTFDGQYAPARDRGDADGTKIIDAADAAKILLYSARNSSGGEPGVSNEFLKAGDVNNDGAVNAIDASIVLTYAAAKGADPNVTIDAFCW